MSSQTASAVTKEYPIITTGYPSLKEFFEANSDLKETIENSLKEGISTADMSQDAPEVVNDQNISQAPSARPGFRK